MDMDMKISDVDKTYLRDKGLIITQDGQDFIRFDALYGWLTEYATNLSVKGISAVVDGDTTLAGQLYVAAQTVNVVRHGIKAMV